MKEIREILSAGNLTEGARERALSIFSVLAEAEAKVHGTTPEEVHFHEVGAVDSVIDIAAIGICLDDLGITDVITPVLYEGEGTVRCSMESCQSRFLQLQRLSARTGSYYIRCLWKGSL